MTADGELVEIENKEVENELVRILQEQDYIMIEKNGNTIHFQRWKRSTGYDCGVAYSINGEEKPTLPYLSKSEPLSTEKWFYYEENYDKWKAQNDN